MQFEDPRTIEIMVNPNGTLWVEKLGEPMRCLGDIKPELTRSIIDTVAGFYGLICNQQHPIIEGNFPLDGSRFEGIIPPCTPAPMFDIRKKAKAIFTLDDYVKNGVLSASQRQVIAELVVKRRNILVVGGTGSGKTTLCNAVIAEMVRLTPNDRIDIIEDTPEIQCAAPNCTPTQTSEQVGMSQLLRAALRLRPDRILVGEVRGREAWDLIQAWNTGHSGGLATIHANTALSGLDRVRSCISANPDAPTLDVENYIAEAVNCIIHIVKADVDENGNYLTPEQVSRLPPGARITKSRKVTEILAVTGYDKQQGAYSAKPIL